MAKFNRGSFGQTSHRITVEKTDGTSVSGRCTSCGKKGIVLRDGSINHTIAYGDIAKRYNTTVKANK